MDDIVINKTSAIERCLLRIREEYEGKETDFRKNITVQDSIVLNLQRACESSIDLANYLIKKSKLGPPQTSRESFDLLQLADVISEELAQSLKKMVGFINLAIHEYQSLNLDIIESIIRNNLQDFEKFNSVIIRANS